MNISHHSENVFTCPLCNASIYIPRIDSLTNPAVAPPAKTLPPVAAVPRNPAGRYTRLSAPILEILSNHLSKTPVSSGSGNKAFFASYPISPFE